jgi:NAD(P)-dependent dehydrogenase (short-subunit alcohol dehydrogenase family)
VTALRFDGQVVAVTGAGNGLGRAYALALADRGARVVVNDLGGATDGTGADTSAAERVVKDIEGAGGEAVANTASVTDAAGAASIVADALAAWGRLDAVISNAGILRDRSLAKLTTEELDVVLDVHLRGGFLVTLAAYRHMREHGGGRIVLTTSASGLFGNFGQANYAAAKLGLVGLLRVLAQEGAKAGAKAGVVANAISPVAGTRLTGRTEEPAPDDPMAPAKVVPMALALAHPSCPSTGEIFLAGGGWFARPFVAVTSGWAPGPDELTPEGVLAHWEQIRGGEILEPADAMAIGSLIAERRAPADRGPRRRP